MSGKHKLVKLDVDKNGEYREPITSTGFCAGCPDHEACMQAYPCSLVKRLDAERRS
jgi:hypothetical protein